ncbi:MAG: hypothetical protein JNK21_06855 [Rhodospirillaceae bacterium]|nr:hypothetical protein [Rhodospirillaceae bacterium]
MSAASPLPQADRPAAESGAGLPVLAVISNGGSTENKKHVGWAEGILAGEPDVHVFHAHGPAEIAAAIQKAAGLKAEIIAVNGGDGTVDMVFAALLNDKPFAAPPMLALLPAGKTNMTAAAWCGAKNKFTGLQHLLHARRKQTLRATPRHILTVDRNDGAAPLRGAFLGAADVVDGILFCRKHIYPLNLPNALSHAMAVCVLVWRSLFTRADATVIEARWTDSTGHEGGEAPSGETGRFFFLGAMTLGRLILGLEPVAAAGSGGVHYLSLTSGVRAVLAAIPRLVTKRVPQGYKRTVRRAEKLTLAFDGAYTLDGELYDAKKEQPLTITAHDMLSFIDLRPS